MPLPDVCVLKLFPSSMIMKIFHDKCLGCPQSKYCWNSKEKAVTTVKISEQAHKGTEPPSVGEQGCESVYSQPKKVSLLTGM